MMILTQDLDNHEFDPVIPWRGKEHSSRASLGYLIPVSQENLRDSRLTSFWQINDL